MSYEMVKHTHTPHGCQTTNAFKRILCFFVSLLFVICLLCICLLHWSDTADQRNRAFVNRNSHAAQKQRAHTLKHIHFDWILANVKLKQQQQTAIGRKKKLCDFIFSFYFDIYSNRCYSANALIIFHFCYFCVVANPSFNSYATIDLFNSANDDRLPKVYCANVLERAIVKVVSAVGEW